MKKYIISTTINPPTKAIKKFDNLKGWNLIVSGDLKTPSNYKLKNGVYLSPKDQEKISKKLSDLIGWNCIQRRNFAMILAFKKGAEIIATVDDDNIPLSNWEENLIIDKKIKVKKYITKEEAFDPISVTNHNHLWHRGFPLQILKNKNKKKKIIETNSNFDIQADFWNGDPDIDAICRMEYAPECNFKKSVFPFTSNKPSPFNSQNTFLKREVIRHYFLFPHIGRMDDIWASYYVEAKGYKVLYNKPSVYQRRNLHDLTKDMKKEFIGYENNLNLIRRLNKSPNNIKDFLPTKSWQAFKLYQRILDL
tara:strand:- start:123 stop:1043 length:921 start_codon:yes stop_codon:yes gene_type:complete